MSIKVDTRLIERGIEATGKLIGNNLRNKRSVKIGDPSTKLIYVDDAETMIYVQGLGTEDGSLTTIAVTLRDKPALILNSPILVEQLASGQWVIYRDDPDGQAQFMAGIKAIPDQRYVNLSQLQYGTLQPHNGMVLRVLSAMYGNDYVSDTLTEDFSTGTVQDTSGSNIVTPTTNNRALGVLIQVIPSTGVLSYKQSSEFIATTSLQSQFATGALPDPDSTAYRIGYLKLVKGVTTADYSHIWQVPEMYSKGNEEWEVTMTFDRTLEANKQIVLDKLIVPSGITLIIKSTAIMKVI